MEPDPNRNNNTDYSLSVLEHRWGTYVARHEEGRHSGGLMGRASRLFRLDFDYELADSVSDSIKQLSQDWNFLNMLVRSIRKWSDADELMQQAGRNSLLRKINALGHVIDRDIKACEFGTKFIFNRPQKLFNLLADCRRKTDELLKEDIREDLEHLANLTFQVHFPYYSFWDTCMSYLKDNLRSIRDADDGCHEQQIYILCDELKLIEKYFDDVGERIRGSKFLENHTFVTHVTSVVVRIANQSCLFWFNRKDTEIARIGATGLVDLHHKIDPRNREFIKLILGFQEALYNVSSKTSAAKSRRSVAASLDEVMGYFCSYILNFCSHRDIDKKLRSLIALFIKTTLKSHSCREDVQCLFAEIDAMVIEAAFLHRAHQENETGDLCPCSYLLTKICFLETQLFLEEQLSTITSPVPFSDKQFLKVNKILKNLREATESLCHEEKEEFGEQNSILTQELNDEVKSLYVSLQSKRMANSMIKHSLRQLLYKIVFFKAESFLSELLSSQNDESFIANGKDQIESFIVELKYFKRVVTNQLMMSLPEEEVVYRQVEAIARRISLLSYSSLPNNDKLKEMLLLFPRLFKKVRDVKAKLLKVSARLPLSSFPKTFVQGFVDFLGRNIMEVLKYDPEPIAPVKHQLKQAQSYLESFKSFLIQVSNSDIHNGEVNDLCTRIRDLAYRLEYVVESIEGDGHLVHSLWLYDLLEDIRLVNEQASNICETSSAVKCICSPRVSGELQSKDATTFNEMMVDLVDQEEEIIDKLMGGSSHRDVVSIVGMAGIGKTTLARKLFNNERIVRHFHRRAWCTVSEVYSRRELLLDILRGIPGITDEIHQMADEDLQNKLRQRLKGCKYLIILDDVWDVAAWNDLAISFPDDTNGSRILITSRHKDVHLEIQPGSDPHLIRLLEDEESWKLLEKKIFKSGTGSCPSELLVVGKQIAEHCQGLPLAIVAIAGVLQKTEKTKDCWEKISRGLSSHVINDPDPENRCKEILELSYKHLPEYLKACFLYLGVFLRDKEIPVSKLLLFWIAEGFIQETETKIVEDVAHDCLIELINRSLVIISKTRSNGMIKACRLHDLLRDLCRSKAKDENFLHLVTGNDEPYASFPASEYDMQFPNRHKLDPVAFESYRLSIYLRRNHFIDSRPSGPRTRSLIFFASVDKEPRCPYEISFICNNFKLLRVLDLECINMGVSFPVEIGQMVQLRYLAVSGYMESIPASIANLWKLRTLVVKGFRGTILLPNVIWSMVSLRHLHVDEHVCFTWQDDNEQVGSSFHLDNLVSFSSPSLSCGDNTINLLDKMPNLLRMKCIFLDSWDSSKGCNVFPALEFLTRLESLKIIYYGGAISSGEFLLPWSLKKLTLSKFGLPWSQLSRIGRLPYLRVLKLLRGAFEGPTWEMNEDEFKELQFLKLDALNIAEWNASYDHLPSLERLVVQNCKDLEEIPLDFAYIPTLKMVEVELCKKSVQESAENIGTETGEIKVVITSN